MATQITNRRFPNGGCLFEVLASLMLGGFRLLAADSPPPRFTFETFDLPGAKETLLADIDSIGRLVGRYKDANDLSHGFFQDGTNVLRFNVTGNTATFATGFDTSGRIVGFYRDAANPDIQHGFLRQTNGTFATIDSPANTTTTYLWRLNDTGQINGYHFENDPFFIRSFQRAANGSFTTNIVFPGSPVGTVARGMNEAGVLTGWKWTDDFALQGVIIKGTNFTQVFTVPGWANTLPGDINETGEIAGTVINADFSDRRGFFRTSDGRTSVFAPPGATETEVFGMNDAGQIVGEYVDQAGKRHGFIASPAVGLDKGHTDIGIAFEEGEWDLHIHSGETDTEYGPDKAVLQFGAASEQYISDSLDFRFLGDAGHSTWILPQVENENLLFLGLAAEEIADGVFVNNTLRVELASVEGPGNFFAWTADPLGKPQLRFNSADGILSSQDFYLLKIGGHQDMNWAFSVPGTYRVGYRVAGTLVAGNRFTQSEVACYTFEVPAAQLPQPPQPDNTAYLITDLGALGGTTSRAFRINEQGHIVGEASRADGSSGAFLWTNGVMVDLGALGGTNSLAFGLNEAGQVVGRAQTAAGHMVAFTWNAAQGMNQVSGLGGMGSFDSSLYAINDAGLAVGQARNSSNQLQAFSWINGVSTAVPLPGGSDSRAWDVNSAGQLSGWGRNASNAIVGFRWSAVAGYEFVGNLVPGADVFAVGINTNGHMAGAIQKDFGHQASSATPPISRAFVWDGRNLTDIGQPEGYHGAAGNYLNDAGWVAAVAHRFNSAGQPAEDSAFLYKVGVNYELNRVTPYGAGWHLQWAHDVNNHGEIVGWGIQEGHAQRRAFLATPATRLTRGHTDIGALFEDGQLELEVHSEELDEEFAPGAALLRLPALTQTTVPTNTAFAFLGKAGAPVWVLSQVEHPKLLFLGLAAEEIAKGVFAKDELKFTLKKVEGPGHFFLYAVDGFRNPVVYWNSRDGLGTNDTRTIIAGGHEDMNWAFTEPGYYRVTIEASGTLVDGNRFTQSDEATYHFEVIGINTQLTLRQGNPPPLSLSVTTEEAIIYQLQSAANVTGPWSDIAQPFIGTGRSKEFNVPVAAGAGFYRVITPGGK